MPPLPIKSIVTVWGTDQSGSIKVLLPICKLLNNEKGLMLFEGKASNSFSLVFRSVLLKMSSFEELEAAAEGEDICHINRNSHGNYGD